jgi:hypothetical protein
MSPWQSVNRIVTQPICAGPRTHPQMKGRRALSRSAQPALAKPHEAILEQSEAARRKLQLSELQATLAALGIDSIRAARHRLVLRYSDPPPLLQSGPTDPTLHVFGQAGTRIISTDGTVYRLDNGREYPAGDPAAAATAISRDLRPAAPDR